MRLRITVRPTGDPSSDLRVAAAVRRDLFAHSPVEIDPDNPLHGTHRDNQRRAYFEFSTRFPDEVDRVLQEYGHTSQVDVLEPPGPVGQPCQNCGNVAGPVLPTVCPNCQFRDIAACPSCMREVPRQCYTPIGGNLFQCPECQAHVRLRFNEPLFFDDGTYRQPLVLIEQA